VARDVGLRASHLGHEVGDAFLAPREREDDREAGRVGEAAEELGPRRHGVPGLA
jgi:hypothetical protein